MERKQALSSPVTLWTELNQIKYAEPSPRPRHGLQILSLLRLGLQALCPPGWRGLSTPTDKRVVNELALWLGSGTPEVTALGPKWNRGQRLLKDRCPSSAIHNSQKGKPPHRARADEWKNKIWYVHTMEYYSVRKRNEALLHATSWMNLKSMPRARSHARKPTLYNSLSMNCPAPGNPRNRKQTSSYGGWE